MFTHSVAPLLGIMAARLCFGMTDACLSEQRGVREMAEKGNVRIISTARVPVHVEDEESMLWAGSQGEMKAKEQLLKYKTGEKAVRGTLNGVILRGTCVARGYLYVTVETSESLRRDSRNLKQELKESLSRTQTPKSQ
jgi:hypothetical protein